MTCHDSRLLMVHCPVAVLCTKYPAYQIASNDDKDIIVLHSKCIPRYETGRWYTLLEWWTLTRCGSHAGSIESDNSIKLSPAYMI